MTNNNKNEEYNVLGFKLSFRPNGDLGNSCSADEVVNYVNQEAAKIKEKFPKLDKAQLAVLLSLQIAYEKMAIDKEYQENLVQLESRAQEALSFVNDIIPKTELTGETSSPSL